MLDAVLTAPVVLKVLGSLGLILVVNRFCKHLLVAIAVGALVLGLWSGHSAGAMCRIASERFFSTGNLLLIAIIYQVIWLSSQMSATGVMRDLVDAVRARVSRRTAMGVLPAVIGVLPMPGGALFSAPMVDSCDTGRSIDPLLKTQTNHWFRHVWESWWPLYPGVLLAMDITGLEMWQFMLQGIALSILSVTAGYLFLLRRIGPEEEGPAVDPPGEPPQGFLGLVSPVLVVVCCYVAVKLSYGALRIVRPEAPELSKYVPLVIGLLAGMVVLGRQRPLSGREWRGILLSRRPLTMAAIVAVVQIYGAFIVARLPSGTHLVAQMRAEMADWGIPVLVIMMLLPLISGLTTGLSVGYVGASFPIIINLLGEGRSPMQVLSITVLGCGFGYMGMLLSPVHVCLVVGSEYFKVPLLRSAAGLVKPAIMVLTGAVLLHFMLRWLGG